MKEIEIFTGPGCSYCTAAKNLLNERELPFIERDVSLPEVLQEMRRRLPHARTIPQIFIGDEYIGGYDDLNHRFSGR